MKRWKKYVLCMVCVCCFGLLTGCGNRNKENRVDTEQNSGTMNNGKNGNSTDNSTNKNNTLTGDGTMTDDNGTLQDNTDNSMR